MFPRVCTTRNSTGISPLNAAFATELFAVIEAAGATSWIYGHHHNNTPDFCIGNTQLRTNQLGYVDEGEGKGIPAGCNT